jgi:hypothetical protein
MAFRDTNITIPDLPNGKRGCPFIYNVTMAVGRNCPNRRDDVKLVQFFLKRIFGNPVNDLRKPPSHLKPMEVDGFCGPTTMGWITFYQFHVANDGAPITTDDRIDRARSAVASISKTGYTINWLNLEWRNDAIIIGDPNRLDLDPEVRARHPDLAAAVAP